MIKRRATGMLAYTCALVRKHVKRIVIGGVDEFSYLATAAVLVFLILLDGALVLIQHS